MEQEQYTNDIFRPAKELSEVFVKFDPDWEIPPDCPFVEPLPTDPLVSIYNKLSIAAFRKVKIFFTGHRGSGKTLQVKRLIDQLCGEDKFLPFYIDIKSVFDPINLEYQDIIFGIVTSVYNSYIGKPECNNFGLGYDKKDGLSKNLTDRFEKWGSTIIEETKKEEGMSAEAGFTLPKFIFWVSGKLKASKETATITRKVIESTMDELFQIFNDMVAEIEKNEGKKVLVIVDGMDKIDFEKAKLMLTTYLDKLKQPACTLLYVIPIAISYLLPVVDLEEKICRLDNIPIFEPIGQFEKFNSSAKEFCEKVMFHRMEEKLIDRAAIEDIIRLSAGVIRLLISNIQKASEKARARGSSVIEKEDIEKVAKETTYFFRQVLTYSGEFKEPVYALTLCKEVLSNPDKPPLNETLGFLVHQLMVIEYPNGPRKYGIHPAIKPLIDEYVHE